MILHRIGIAVGGLFLLVLLLGLLLGGGAVSGRSQTASGPCGGPPSLSLGTGAIAWPMPAGSYTLTSGYGPRWGSFHRGIDLAAPIGTLMYAAHDGVAEQAGPAAGFGLWVVVTGTVDGQTVSTVYGHNNRNLVTPGQSVRAGDPIAEVGNRGQSTGPHLHFEVWPGGRFGGAPVDPAGWLSSNVRQGETTAEQPRTPPAADTVTLSGPVPPQGRQASWTLTGEELANVRAIVAAAKGALPGDQEAALRAAVIAVATASQESTLRVIDYGDRAGPDSRGLFQQRDPWGPWADRMDPVTSTQLFLHGGRGGQRGLFDFPDWQSVPLTVAAQRVQVSAFGNAYAKWEAQAIRLVADAAGVAPADGPLGQLVPCVA